MAAGSPGSFVSGLYDVGGYDILTAAPARTLPSRRYGSVSVANFGLVEKMTGSTAITSNYIIQKENGRVFVDTSMRALGVIGKS